MKVLTRLRKVPSPLEGSEETPPPGLELCPMKPYRRQVEFLSLTVDEALYGGAAGGGKSEALLRWLAEGILQPDYTGIAFRRTYPQLSKSNEGLIEKSSRMFQPLGGKWNGTDKAWRFPSGAIIELGHLPYEKSIEDYQGPSYHRCVAADTPILMADGSYVPIANVQPGQLVATLEGPRPVTARIYQGRKECWAISAGNTWLEMTSDHVILTANGWAAPLAQKATRSYEFGNIAEFAMALYREREPLHGCRYSGSLLGPEREQQTNRRTFHRENAAYSIRLESDYAGFDDSLQEVLPPQALSCRIVLLARAAQLNPQESFGGFLPRAANHALALSKQLNSQYGCHASGGSRGEQSRPKQATDQRGIPSQGDAVERIHATLPPDDPAHIRGRSRVVDRRKYDHPYTNKPRVSSEATLSAETSAVPVGERDVYDLRVAGASHYISVGGIVSRNCAFDELTQFSERQYLYLNGRIRHPPGYPIKCGIRAGANPGGIGHAWVKRRFVTPAALKAIAGLTSRDPSPPGTVFTHNIETPEGPVSIGFVPARLADNPYIDQDEYRKKLATNDPVMRERLLNGDWSVTEDSPIRGDWFRYFETKGDILAVLDQDNKSIATIDRRQCQRFATIDTAGTSKDKADEAKGRAASWSVCAIWDYDRKSDRLFLRHVWRARAAWAELKAGAARVLTEWNVRRVRIENAHVGAPLRDELKAVGFDATLVGPVLPGMAEGHRGAKLDRAVASGLLARFHAGNLLIPCDAAPWVPDWEHEHTAWSGGPDETVDQIDASSYGAYEAKQARNSWGGVIPVK